MGGFKSRLLWKTTAVGMLIIVSILSILVIYNRYSADTTQSSTKIRGYVYGTSMAITANLSIYNPLPGSQPLGGASVTVISKNYSVSTVTDVKGYYEITIPKPYSCTYKVIASAGGYNSDRQFWGFSAKASSTPNMGMMGLNFMLNKQTDSMLSRYNGATYFQGYEGGYRASHWDASYFRNIIGAGAYETSETAFGDVYAPTSAQITLTVKSNWQSAGGAMPGATTLPYNVKLQASAILGNWANEMAPAVSSPVGEVSLNLNKSLKNQKIIIKIDLSSLTAAQRYSAYLNGFKVTLLDLMPTIQQQNISIDFTRSEDGGATQINYSGQGHYWDIPESMARSCIVTVAELYYLSGLPYGWGMDGRIDPNTGLPDGKPVDCSSLVNAAYDWAGMPTYSIPYSDPHGPVADDISSYFIPIKQSSLKPGDIVSRQGHIGLFVQSSGSTKTFIHAKGHKYGILKESLADLNSFWSNYGRHPWFNLNPEERK